MDTKDSIGRKYWATEDKKDCVTELLTRINKQDQGYRNSILNERTRRSYRYYYGDFANEGDMIDGSPIGFAGEAGELLTVGINQFRNLIKHQLTLTTSVQPAFDLQAVNADTKSLQQTKIGKSVLEYYFSEKNIAKYLRLAAESALVVNEGYVAITWEPSLGQPYATKKVKTSDGQTQDIVVNEGDVQVQQILFGDVFSDMYERDWSKKVWVCYRTQVNKWDLIARYPKFKDGILNAGENQTFRVDPYFKYKWQDDSDMTTVWSFYHNRTPGCPNGRFVYFVDEDTILFDGGLPYRKLPVFRITPGEILATGQGYSDSMDMLAPQEVLNNNVSSVHSILDRLGIQNVLVPNGSNFSAEQLSKRLALLKYDPDLPKPETLMLGDVNQNFYSFAQLMQTYMEMISGINSVTRGQPDESLKSGVALALVQSMSVQFNSGFQAQWAQLLEDSATFILDLLKDYAKTERIVAMVGRHNRNMVRSFTGEDLDSIQRVQVKIGNPLTSTTSGKLAMAQDLLSNGIIKTADQYLTVLETGNIEPLTDGLSSELDLIARENDAMMDGKTVPVLAGDNHRLHYAEHRALLSDPEIRMNSALTPNVLMHLQEHIAQFKSEDPLMSILIGEQPAQALAPQSASPEQMDFDASMAATGPIPEITQPPQPPIEQIPMDMGGVVPPPVV